LTPYPYFIIPLAVLTLAAWVRADKAAGVVLPGGAVELRHGKRYLIVGIACLIFWPMALLYVLSRGASWTQFDVLAFIVVFLAFALYAIWMVLDAVNTRVLVSQDQIEAITPLGRHRWVKWNEIRTIRYNLFAQCLVLTGGDQGLVRVHVRLRGFRFLLQRLHAEPGLITRFRGLAHFV
jgi:hypothetical protein